MAFLEAGFYSSGGKTGIRGCWATFIEFLAPVNQVVSDQHLVSLSLLRACAPCFGLGHHVQRYGSRRICLEHALYPCLYGFVNYVPS